ncbi:Uncharacterised protein [Bordetella pertussis]|nr:Uncharacterised protein [Bordetella pertussis]
MSPGGLGDAALTNSCRNPINTSRSASMASSMACLDMASLTTLVNRFNESYERGRGTVHHGFPDAGLLGMSMLQVPVPAGTGTCRSLRGVRAAGLHIRSPGNRLACATQSANRASSNGASS